MHTPTEDLILLKSVLDNDEQGGADQTTFTLYSVGGGLTLGNPRVLALPGQVDDYSLAAYGSGFIVYDAGLQHVLYYTSSQASPQQLDLAASKYSSAANTTNLSVGTSTLTATYTITGSSTIVANTGNSNPIEIFTVPGIASTATTCGNAFICVLFNKTLAVYSLASGQPDLLYTVPDVKAIETEKTNVLLVTADGVLNFDPQSRSGYLEYSFGGYSYCGYQAVSDHSYTLCIASAQNQHSVILIDQTAVDSDSIDKAILGVRKLEETAGVSITGNNIFISVKGPLVADKTTGSYGTDSTVQPAINAKLKTEVSKLGIDPKSYNITYLPPS